MYSFSSKCGLSSLTLDMNSVHLFSIYCGHWLGSGDGESDGESDLVFDIVEAAGLDVGGPVTTP